MSGAIQIANNNLSTTITPQTVFTHPGDNGVQIANQQGGTVNIYLPVGNSAIYNATNIINMEYYNLFVIGGETINDPFFLVEKDRALTISENVSPDISAQFAKLTPEAIATIKTFPSIFATENHYYGRTDTDHLAMFGFVTDVKVQENGIRVYFQCLCSIPQQRLNNIAINLAIQGSSSFNEFNRRHWAIKRIPLIEELKSAGISVLLPTQLITNPNNT